MNFIRPDEAFVKVPREKLWNILEKKGINKNIKIIIKLYIEILQKY